MQSELVQSEELHSNRLLAQTELNRKIESMEADVKNFNEKDELGKKIRAFNQNKEWIRLKEQKAIREVNEKKNMP